MPMWQRDQSAFEKVTMKSITFTSWIHVKVFIIASRLAEETHLKSPLFNYLILVELK